jgi:hypothetical protein
LPQHGRERGEEGEKPNQKRKSNQARIKVAYNKKLQKALKNRAAAATTTKGWGRRVEGPGTVIQQSVHSAVHVCVCKGNQRGK